MLGRRQEAGPSCRPGQFGIQVNMTWPYAWQCVSRGRSGHQDLHSHGQGEDSPDASPRAGQPTCTPSVWTGPGTGGTRKHSALPGGHQAHPAPWPPPSNRTVTRGIWQGGGPGGQGTTQGARGGVTGGVPVCLHMCKNRATSLYTRNNQTAAPGSWVSLSSLDHVSVRPPPAFALAKPWVTGL